MYRSGLREFVGCSMGLINALRLGYIHCAQMFTPHALRKGVALVSRGYDQDTKSMLAQMRKKGIQAVDADRRVVAYTNNINICSQLQDLDEAEYWMALIVADDKTKPNTQKNTRPKRRAATTRAKRKKQHSNQACQSAKVGASRKVQGVETRGACLGRKLPMS